LQDSWIRRLGDKLSGPHVWAKTCAIPVEDKSADNTSNYQCKTVYRLMENVRQTALQTLHDLLKSASVMLCWHCSKR